MSVIESAVFACIIIVFFGCAMESAYRYGYRRGVRHGSGKDRRWWSA